MKRTDGTGDCPGRCVRVVEPTIHRDHRGTLSSLNFADLGFTVVRSFIVSGEPGAVRGGHAHLVGRQLLMQATGRITLRLVDHGLHQVLQLPEDARAVILEPGVWAEQTYVTDGSSLVVYCDTQFDPDDYVTGVPAEPMPS